MGLLCNRLNTIHTLHAVFAMHKVYIYQALTLTLTRLNTRMTYIKTGLGMRWVRVWVMVWVMVWVRDDVGYGLG